MSEGFEIQGLGRKMYWYLSDCPVKQNLL